MNKKLLKKVRDRIADESIHYNQYIFWDYPDSAHDFTDIIRDGKFCGTSCCIAGHAIAAAGVEAVSMYLKDGFASVAQHLLGLTQDEADLMFNPSPLGDYHDGYYYTKQPTRQEAVAMLDYAIKTGIIFNSHNFRLEELKWVDAFFLEPRLGAWCFFDCRDGQHGRLLH